ncbi:hypothetical protein V3N99_03285 [Dermatophilaceae bacterium Soc4.6]
MTSETGPATAPSAVPEFDDPDLVERLVQLGGPALDHLSFGVIGFDSEDLVVVYNAYESTRAGIGPDRVLGRNIFIEVAPCTNNFLVAQRFVDEPDLDEQLDYVFTLRMRPTPVRLRLVARRGHPLRYMLVRPA